MKAKASWSDAANQGLATSIPAIQELPSTLQQAASLQQLQTPGALSVGMPQSTIPAHQVQPSVSTPTPANPELTLTAPVAASATPATVAKLVSLVNLHLKAEHHITQAQVQALQDALGDVETLLELSIMQADALNEVLRGDGKLHGMQIVAVRRTLKQLGS